MSGFFSRTRRCKADLGRLTSLMLRELCDRGPDSAGFAVYGGGDQGHDQALHGEPQRRDRLERDRRASSAQAIGAEVAVEEVEDHAIFKTTGAGDTARKWLIDNVPGAYVLSQGQSIEIFKGVGNPAAIMDRLALERRARDARHRPHPHGDRVRRHGRGLAPVLDRRRHLPGAQRLAVEPQPPARAARAPRRALPDRQ